MPRLLLILLIPILLIGTRSDAIAQFAGSRAGAEPEAKDLSDIPMLSLEVAKGVIAIEGRAEMRVRPTKMRIVLAVTTEGKSAKDTSVTIESKIGELKKAWRDMGIPSENIVEDFIAILPQYEWEFEKQANQDVGIEKKSGYHMQTNLHLEVPNDGIAFKVLSAAFEQGVTDIVAFDYGAENLDEIKMKTREKALKAAESKSKLLLTPVFEKIPRVINVQEQTKTRYPESLYRSFVNTQDEEISSGWRRDFPTIRALRPRSTYYRGLTIDADDQVQALPMHPEISVVSTVRLYYASPAASSEKK